tara:strand:+ start:195 stop:704 length:510 start_codon:yes stop_codon:yes gene_type:complete
MAIVVEDATGLDNAESYADVAFFKSYFAARGIDVTALTDDQIEQNLRLGTEYIDIRWGKSAPGVAISEDQALCFPTDYFITDPVSLPRALVRATVEYAWFSYNNGLFLDNDGSSGPGITFLKEKVGPIETETEWSGSGDGAVGRKYPIVAKADQLMRQITLSGNGGVYR